MCGILFCCYCAPNLSGSECKENVINPKESQSINIDPQIVLEHHKLLADSFLEHRGPDVSKQHRLTLSSHDLQGWMRGCVLHLRGQQTSQPLVDDKGNALLWNAEIFDGIKVSREENDTQVLFSHLTKCETDEQVLKTLEQVRGPWAVIYWQAEKSTLWFGRDIYGRRSLLWHLPESPSELFALTSVAVGNLNYSEVPSVGIFSLDFSQTALLPTLTLFPWYQCKWPGSNQAVFETCQEDIVSFLTLNHKLSVMIPISIDKKHVLKLWIPKLNKAISNKEDTEEISVSEKDFVSYLCKTLEEDTTIRLLSEQLIDILQDAVMKRVNNLPIQHSSSNFDPNQSDARIAVLFSGGLDSSVIAALLDRCLPPNEPIDLLNVAFEQSPPTKTTVKPKQKRSKQGKHKSKLQQEKNIADDITHSDHLSAENLTILHDLPSLNIDNNEEKNNNALGASNDLSNSLCEGSFNSKGILPESGKELDTPNRNYNPYDVPDRRTGYIALSELNPKRKWNFVEINVSQEELQSLRSSRIGRLIYPLQTVLDDSIGCAVWFAARGRGRLVSDANTGQDFVSNAKVILCGMAADEQFAGYSRHRAQFYKMGEKSLVDQLEQEIWRISTRNLGRDDRIIGDLGKEARFPFLDENFTEFVSKIPVFMRANLCLPRGLGEKFLLRMGAFTLGLIQTACQPKRAIQFGSKIAKLDDSKEKGSDVCPRLL